MILVDTSIWIDHLRAEDSGLVALLDANSVLAHPFVVGEIALGRLKSPDPVIEAMQDLPQAAVASEAEVLSFIRQEKLAAFGVGYVDAHLLAASRLTHGAALWTRDRRLAEAATRLGLAHAEG